MDKEQLKSVIESILFATGEPVEISKLAKLTGTEKPILENVLGEMESDFSQVSRGVVILRKENEVQLATKPENSDYISAIIKSEVQGNLSSAALEVLSIVAYKGPISRAEIEAIRGLNCTYTLRNLLLRGVVERIENPKNTRSYLYKISFEFLRHLGIQKVEELPDWEELNKNAKLENVLNV